MNPAAQLIKPEETALIVVDIQSKLIPFIFEKERVIHNTTLLIRLAKILNLPILLTTQYCKGLGDTVEEIRAEIPDVESLDKVEFGCFGSGPFCEALDNLPDVTNVLVTGIESHICIAQTVLGALESDYTVHVAADGVSSRTEANWRIGLKRMEQAGAVISSTEMIIYELLHQSGTAAFKAMLPHLK